MRTQISFTKLGKAGLLCLGFALGFSTSTLAEETKPTSPGHQMDGFAMIAGSWWLEQRCRTLQLPERGEFEWRVGQVNQLLQQTLQPQLIFQIQKAAQLESEKMGCGDTAGNMVAASVDVSRALHADLDPERAKDSQGWLTHTFNQLYMTAGLTGIAERCKLTNAEEAVSQKEQLEKISQAFADYIEKPALIDVILGARAKGFAGPVPACNANVEKQVKPLNIHLLSLERIFL